MTATGDVSDYDVEKRLLLRSKMAQTLKVLLERISLTISAASVELLFTIEVATLSDAKNVSAAVGTEFPTADAASDVLGVSVLSMPVAILETQPAPPSPLSPPVGPYRPLLRESSQSTRPQVVIAAVLVSTIPCLALCILAVWGRKQIKMWMERHFSKGQQALHPPLKCTDSDLRRKQLRTPQYSSLRPSELIVRLERTGYNKSLHKPHVEAVIQNPPIKQNSSDL